MSERKDVRLVHKAYTLPCPNCSKPVSMVIWWDTWRTKAGLTKTRYESTHNIHPMEHTCSEKKGDKDGLFGLS